MCVQAESEKPTPFMGGSFTRVGVRKCEANAIVPMPAIARELVEDAITSYLGNDAVKRFQKKRDAVNKVVQEFKDKTGMSKALNKALELIDKESKNKPEDD